MNSPLPSNVATPTERRAVLPLHELRPLRDSVIVEPLYDPDEVRGIQLPNSAKNSVSSQGIVVAAGPTADFAYPDHVVYRAYFSDNNTLLGRELLTVLDEDIVSSVVGERLVPRWGYALIRPEFAEFVARTAQGLFVPPQTARDRIKPPSFGTVLAVAEGCQDVKPGDRVVMPSYNPITLKGWGGVEVAFPVDGLATNLYLIPEVKLLATIG